MNGRSRTCNCAEAEAGWCDFLGPGLRSADRHCWQERPKHSTPRYSTEGKQLTVMQGYRDGSKNAPFGRRCSHRALDSIDHHLGRSRSTKSTSWTCHDAHLATKYSFLRLEDCRAETGHGRHRLCRQLRDGDLHRDVSLASHSGGANPPFPSARFPLSMKNIESLSNRTAVKCNFGL